MVCLFYNISIYIKITYSFMHSYIHPVTIVLFWWLHVCVCVWVCVCVHVCVCVCVCVCNHADFVFSVFKQTAWCYDDLLYLPHSFLRFMTSASLAPFCQKKKKKAMSKLITWSSFIYYTVICWHMQAQLLLHLAWQHDRHLMDERFYNVFYSSKYCTGLY